MWNATLGRKGLSHASQTHVSSPLNTGRKLNYLRQGVNSTYIGRLRVRSLVVDGLRLENKGSRFESGH